MSTFDRFQNLLLAFLEDPGAPKAFLTSKAFSAPCSRLCAALKSHVPQLATILDVGANVGQFALAAARHYPEATIYSFEPLPEVFKELKANTEANRNIKPFNWAIGNHNGTIVINQNIYSRLSSCLKINETNDNPRYRENRTTPIAVHIFRLDTIEQMTHISPHSLLKIDVQGMELDVIKGSEHILTEVSYILCEAALVELYKGQLLFEDLHECVRRLGYKLVAPLYINKGQSGKVIEVDVLYQRSGPPESSSWRS